MTPVTRVKPRLPRVTALKIRLVYLGQEWSCEQVSLNVQLAPVLLRLLVTIEVGPSVRCNILYNQNDIKFSVINLRPYIYGIHHLSVKLLPISRAIGLLRVNNITFII